MQLHNSGAYCLLCYVTREQALEPDRVKNGFFIERSIEETRRIYNEMVENGRMNPNILNDLKKHLADSAERFGITMEPLIRGYLNPQLNIFPLHCEINALRWWENFIVLWNIRKLFPDEMPNWKNNKPYFVKTKEQNAAMKTSRTNMRNKAQDPDGLDMKLDLPESSGAQVKHFSVCLFDLRSEAKTIKKIFTFLCLKIMFSTFHVFRVILTMEKSLRIFTQRRKGLMLSICLILMKVMK